MFKYLINRNHLKITTILTPILGVYIYDKYQCQLLKNKYNKKFNLYLETINKFDEKIPMVSVILTDFNGTNLLKKANFFLKHAEPILFSAGIDHRFTLINKRRISNIINKNLSLSTLPNSLLISEFSNWIINNTLFKAFRKSKLLSDWPITTNLMKIQYSSNPENFNQTLESLKGISKNSPILMSKDDKILATDHESYQTIINFFKKSNLIENINKRVYLIKIDSFKFKNSIFHLFNQRKEIENFYRQLSETIYQILNNK